MLTTLIALLFSVQVHHLQVPVVADQPVAIATVTLPEGACPRWQFKTEGLPGDALRRAYVEDGKLYVDIDAAKIRDLSRPFRIRMKARGVKIEETGALEHRLAVKVRSAGDDGVAAYRIPGLVTTLKGTLVATYDIRHDNSHDLQGDIDVGISRSTDGGRTWEPMITAMDMGEYGGLPQELTGIGDPCILLDEVTGDLLLFAARAHGNSPGGAPETVSAPRRPRS